MEEGQNPFADPARDVMLASLLTAPSTPAFLYQCLRLLSVDEVVSLLQLLMKWLKRHTKHNSREIRRLYRHRFPSHAQVIEWICLLLDAHFMTLALSPAAHPLLRRLTSLVRREIALVSMSSQALLEL